MLLTVGLIATLAWVLIALVVLADMMRKSIPLGCLGLALLPIAPFFWVVWGYSGNRAVVGFALYTSALVAFAAGVGISRGAQANLQPFLEAARTESGLSCALNTVSRKSYTVVCEPTQPVATNHYDVEQMVDMYQAKFVDTLAPQYPQTLAESGGQDIVIAIPTPSAFMACFRVRNPGQVVGSWYSATEDPCDLD